MWKLDWRYGKKKKGMYIDGHEQEDVVQYWDEFLKRWKEYKKRMVTVMIFLLIVPLVITLMSSSFSFRYFLSKWTLSQQY